MRRTRSQGGSPPTPAARFACRTVSMVLPADVRPYDRINATLPSGRQVPFLAPINAIPGAVTLLAAAPAPSPADSEARAGRKRERGEE